MAALLDHFQRQLWMNQKFWRVNNLNILDCGKGIVRVCQSVHSKKSVRTGEIEYLTIIATMN